MTSGAQELSALILFTSRMDAVVEFYRAIGVPLEAEQHDDGVLHYACDLGGTHIAVFESSPGDAPEFRSAGSSIAGFSVQSLEIALEAARSVHANIIKEPTEYPWGVRALVSDPDGRVVELFKRPEP